MKAQQTLDARLDALPLRRPSLTQMSAQVSNRARRRGCRWLVLVSPASLRLGGTNPRGKTDKSSPQTLPWRSAAVCRRFLLDASVRNPGGRQPPSNPIRAAAPSAAVVPDAVAARRQEDRPPTGPRQLSIQRRRRKIGVPRLPPSPSRSGRRRETEGVSEQEVQSGLFFFGLFRTAFRQA